MKISLAEITAEKTVVELTPNHTFLCEGMACKISPTGSVNIFIQNDETVVLTGQVKGMFRLTCDRCLARFDHPFSTAFHYCVEKEEDAQEVMPEMECLSRDCDILTVIDDELDIDAVFCEQILLAVPGRQLCRKGCKGVCHGCGVDLNSEICNCSTDSTTSPFAKLAQMVEEKNNN